MPKPTIKSSLTNAWKDYSRIVRLEEADVHGMCRCVSCDRGLMGWDSGDIHAGHYLAARALTSPLKFFRHNIHPQCRWCNTGSMVGAFRPHSVKNNDDVVMNYTTWMLEKYGRDQIESIRTHRNLSMNWTLPEAIEWRQVCKTHLAAIKAARLDPLSPWPCEIGEYTPAVKAAA